MTVDTNLRGGTMKATEAQQYLGKWGKLPVEGGKLLMNVECHDVKQAYGRTDVLMIPIEGAGVGNAWVSIERVQWVS